MCLTPGYPRQEDQPVAAARPHAQAEDALEELAGCLGCPGPKGAPVAPCSEPDLITAHAGHSIDVAQHWEADETSAGEEATRLRF